MQKVIQLTPPRLSNDCIEDKISCIRAHRERIFQVSFEKKKDKIIFHNYGHGGAGWTFLFGCVNESLRQFDAFQESHSLKKTPISVIGAGCYGLLTAIMLAFKGYPVQIIAEETENIPSYKAAGFFFPRPRKMSTPDEITIFESLGIESYTVYQQIAYGDHPFIEKGTKILPAYFGLDIDPGFKPFIARGLMPVAKESVITFGATVHRVHEYRTLFINSSVMMEEFHRLVRKLSIPLIKKTVHHFNDVSATIIFNCTGMGAKKLTGDTRLIPVQGHLITLQNQPSREHLQYMINVKVTMQTSKNTPRDELIYFAPKESGILGITFLRGQDSLTANHQEFERLLHRSRQFFGI